MYPASFQQLCSLYMVNKWLKLYCIQLVKNANSKNGPVMWILHNYCEHITFRDLGSWIVRLAFWNSHSRVYVQLLKTNFESFLSKVQGRADACPVMGTGSRNSMYSNVYILLNVNKYLQTSRNICKLRSFMWNVEKLLWTSWNNTYWSGDKDDKGLTWSWTSPNFIQTKVK